MSTADAAILFRKYLLSCAGLLPLAALSWWLLRRYCLNAFGLPALPGLKDVLRAALAGLLIGLGALALTLLPALIAGSYSPGSRGWLAFAYTAGAGAAGVSWLTVIFLVAALFEELAFRAVLLGYLALLLWWLAHAVFTPPTEPAARQSWNLRAWLISGLSANLAVSLAFGAVHLHNPGASLGAGANIALAGLLLGLCFWQRGDIAMAFSLHYSWNMGLALLGLPVSGMALLHAPLGFGISGAVPGLLSGGAFGPEDSLCATVALSLACALLLRRQLRGPASADEVRAA